MLPSSLTLQQNSSKAFPPSPLSPRLPPTLRAPTYCHRGAPGRQLSLHPQPYTLSTAKLALGAQRHCQELPSSLLHPGCWPRIAAAVTEPPSGLPPLGSAVRCCRLGPCPRGAGPALRPAAACRLHKPRARLPRIHLLGHPNSWMDSEIRNAAGLSPLCRCQTARLRNNEAGSSKDPVTGQKGSLT